MITALDRAKSRLKKAHGESQAGEFKKAAEDAARAIRAIVEAANASNLAEAEISINDAFDLLGTVFDGETNPDELRNFVSAKAKQAGPMARKYLYGMGSVYATNPSLRPSAEQITEWCTALGCYRHMMAVALLQAAVVGLNTAMGAGGKADAAVVYEDAGEAFRSAADFYRTAALWEGRGDHEEAEMKLEYEIARMLGLMAVRAYEKASQIWDSSWGDPSRKSADTDRAEDLWRQADADKKTAASIKVK
jgi:hypothetical protein